MKAKTICAVLKVKNKTADKIRPFTVDDRPLVLLEKHDNDFALSLLLLGVFIVIVVAVVAVVVIVVVVIVIVIEYRNLYLNCSLFFFCEKK